MERLSRFKLITDYILILGEGKEDENPTQDSNNKKMKMLKITQYKPETREASAQTETSAPHPPSFNNVATAFRQAVP